MQSRLGFVYENVRIRGFNGTGGACMEWENTSASPQFSEQNSIRKLDTFDCTKDLRLVNTSGQNSFLYNNINDWHCGVNAGQTCLSLDGNGDVNNLLMFGGTFDLKVNGNGSTAMNVISATGGAIMERKDADITGELTSGSGPLYIMNVDASSEINISGYINVADGTIHAAGAQNTSRFAHSAK